MTTATHLQQNKSLYKSTEVKSCHPRKRKIDTYHVIKLNVGGSNNVLLMFVQYINALLQYMVNVLTIYYYNIHIYHIITTNVSHYYNIILIL